MASAGTGGTFHLEVDGVSTGTTINVPDTTGWNTWASVNQASVALPAGQHVLKIAFDSNGTNTHYVGNLDYLVFTPVPSVPPPPVPPPLPPPPPPVEAPFGGTPFGIAANATSVLEAENFDDGGETLAYHDTDTINQGTSTYRKNSAPGVDLDTINDAGPGIGISYAKASEFLNYTVNITKGADYNIGFRVASAGAGGTLHLELDGTPITNATLKVLNTGGWNTYITSPINGVTLPAGTHILKVAFDSNGATGYVANLNYLTFAPTAPVVPTGTSTPFGGTAPTIPATGSLTIEAENYDVGGETVAYHDTEKQNLGGKGRTNEGVDVESNSDGGNGLSVGFTKAGEWMKYTVNVAVDGNYTIDYRLASMGLGGTFHLESDGTPLPGTTQVPDTTGWDNWSTINQGVVPLTAGKHVLRIVFDTASSTTGYTGNINWMRFTKV